MSAIVIVTKNQYVLANKIHHVTLNESYEFHEYRNEKGKLVGGKTNFYQISIIYTPDTAVQNGRNDTTECLVSIRGKIDAYRVYKDLIEQIREQCPDQLFLNKALENLLGDDDFAKMENEQLSNKDDFGLVEIAKSMTKSRAKKARKAKKVRRKR